MLEMMKVHLCVLKVILWYEWLNRTLFMHWSNYYLRVALGGGHNVRKKGYPTKLINVPNM